jgi:hypothetical protein
MSDPPHPDPDVATLLRELEAARARLAHPRKSPRGGATALKAYALCDEVERLCQQAAVSSDGRRAKTLIATARSHLDELQKLLGLH